MNKVFRVLERLWPGRVVWAAVLMSALAPSWPYASAATFKKVFSSTDIGAYNQWLSQHRDEYQSLPPLYISSQVVSLGTATDDYTRRIRLNFYSATGELVRSRLLSGKVWVQVSFGRSLAYVSEWPERANPESLVVTILDRSGNIILSGPARTDGGFTGPSDGGLLFRGWADEEGNATRSYLEVLSSSGQVIGRIEGFGATILQAHLVYSPLDTTYVLPLSAGRVLVLNREGVALWDTIFGGNVSLAISDSARLVAVGTEDGSVVAHDLASRRTSVFPSPSKRAIPRVGVSADGRRIAAYAANALQVINVDSNVVSPPVRVGGVELLGAIGFLGDRAVVVDINGKIATVLPRDSVGVVAGLPGFPRPPETVRVTRDAVLAYGKDIVSVYRLEEQ